MGQSLDNRIKQILTDDKSSGFYGLWRDCASTAQEGLDAHNQFLHTKRLLQVIVGSHLKSMDDIAHCGACREKDNWRLPVRFAYAAHEFIAIHPRHHHVGYEHIGLVGSVKREGLLAIVGNSHVKALTIKCVLDDHGQGALILGQQYVDFPVHVSLIVKVVPLPFVLSTSMLQPCLSTIVLT